MNNQFSKFFDQILSNSYQREHERKDSKPKIKSINSTSLQDRKSSRWTPEEFALYISFALNMMKDHQISFKSKRRDYLSFDKKVSQHICKTLYKNKSDGKKKGSKAKGLMTEKKCKSKFNTLKRYYRQNSQIDDFAELMEMEANRILINEANPFCEELKFALQEWRKVKGEKKCMEKDSEDEKEEEYKQTHFAESQIISE